VVKIPNELSYKPTIIVVAPTNKEIVKIVKATKVITS
jgi:hypothetical protein